MNFGSTNDEERALREMSALADGECEPGQLLAACEAWRREPQARAAWHTYSLIGDVMRSEDLASSAAHDEAFLRRLRGRLADEPVVLAPMAAPAVQQEALPSRSVRLVAGGGAAAGARRSQVRRRWVSPAAVAAGLMMATGAMVVMRDSAQPEGVTQQMAAVPVQQRSLPPAIVVSPGEDELIRNAQLDRYLNAHRQFSQGAALAMPGAVRQVAVNPANR
jgi:sigma-E factor negative regulatory protein RseA